MYRSLFALAITLGSLSIGANALAADIFTQSEIDRVTLFADRAEITRQVTFQSDAGRHRLIVSGLPDSIMGQSLQLDIGDSEAAVRFGQVSMISRPLAGPSDAQVRQILEEIADFERKQAKEHDAIAAEETRLTFIRGISEELGSGEADKLRRGNIDPEQLLGLFNLVREESYGALSEITSSRLRIEELDELIRLKRRELEELDGGGRSELVAAIDIQSEASASGSFALVYQVRGGAWRPIVDARLDTTSGALEWTQLAMVNQRTGEDWNDVELVLSTSQPSMGDLPELQPWVIDIQAPIAPLAESEVYSSQRANLTARGLAKEAVVADAVRPAAEVVSQGLDTRFLAAERVTVPSGGSEHQVFIGDFPQKAELGRKTIPRYRSDAVVTARFELAVPAPVPAAEIRLYRDGGYIGSTRKPVLAPGSELEFEFGRDERIEVSYRLDRDNRSSEGIVTDYRRITRNYEIVVVSRHADPIALTVLDQMPVPRDERIEVEMTAATTPPSRRDVDDRDGVVAWDLELLPGVSQTIGFGYSVVHPNDLEVTHF